MNIVALLCIVLFLAGVLCVAFVKSVQEWLANFVMKGGFWFNLFIILLIVVTCCLFAWICYGNWPQISGG